MRRQILQNNTNHVMLDLNGLDMLGSDTWGSFSSKKSSIGTVDDYTQLRFQVLRKYRMTADDCSSEKQESEDWAYQKAVPTKQTEFVQILLKQNDSWYSNFQETPEDSRRFWVDRIREDIWKTILRVWMKWDGNRVHMAIDNKIEHHPCKRQSTEFSLLLSFEWIKKLNWNI